MTLLHYLFLLLTSASCLLAQQTCSSDYTNCSPAGASVRDVPPIGPALGFLYLEVVSTVQPAPASGSNAGSAESLDGPVRRAASVSLCCAHGTQCLLMGSFEIPMCYDQFTTDYSLPDGSYGTVSNGSYTSADGGQANLITGDYTAQDGTQSNIYDEDPADKPDTTGMSFPTPFTSSGVGSAIPASQLGTAASPTGLTTSRTTPSGSMPSSTTSTSENTTTSQTETLAYSSWVTASATNLPPMYPPAGNYTYGSPTNTTASQTVLATGTSGAPMTFTYPSPYFPFINIAAASLITCWVPKLLAVIVALLLVY